MRTTAGSLLSSVLGYLKVYLIAALISFGAFMIISVVLKKDSIYPISAIYFGSFFTSYVAKKMQRELLSLQQLFILQQCFCLYSSVEI